MLKNEDLVKELYNTTFKPVIEIAKLTENKPWKIQEWIHDTFNSSYIQERKSVAYANSKTGEKNPMKGKSKEQHHNYIGDVSDGKGYLMRIKPDWYTGRVGCKHVFAHHIVMCEALGITEIPKGFHIHHIDGNKTNNDMSNLALLSAGAHTRLHQLERATTSRKA